MRGFWKFGSSVVTFTMVALMMIAFFSALIWRFGLVSIKPALLYFGFGIVLIVGGGLLKLYEQFGGKFFAVAGAILFAIGMYKAVWPNTSAATNHAQEVADVQAALALNNTVAPKAVRCDRESATQYWDGVTGEPKVYYVINEDAHRIMCADRKGFDAFTRHEYKAVTPEMVKIINRQDPPETPKPIATPVPVVMVVPVVQPPSEPSPEPSLEPTAAAMVTIHQPVPFRHYGPVAGTSVRGSFPKKKMAEEAEAEQ